MYTDKRKDNALLRPFKKAGPGIIIDGSALVVMAINSLTSNLSGKKLIHNYGALHEEVSKHLRDRTLVNKTEPVEGQKYLFTKYMGKGGGYMLFGEERPKPKKPKGMSVDEVTSAVQDLVAGQHPADWNRDNNGQLVIYTDIFQWDDGTYHREEEQK